MKLLAVVEIEFGDPVVVSEEKIGVTGVAQVSGHGGQGPAARIDTHLATYFFERAVAHVVKEIFATAILRVLKTLRHHFRRFQMPQVNILRIVATQKQIQPTITIVIKPDRGVGIYPRWQSHFFSDASKAMSSVVVKQLRFTPLVEKQVFVTIIVVVAPDRTHRHACTHLVYVCYSHLRG